MSHVGELRPGWTSKRIDEIARLNPSREGMALDPSSLVHFVPMGAVEEEFGGIDVSTTRPLIEVVKGYTVFRTNDVIFAKITPCMENGKLAVIPKLEYGWAFGSTEFHVLRGTEAVRPRWLALFLSRTDLRRDAQRAMTGSAGQLRVPLAWLSEQTIPIAPLAEQDRIISKIEDLFSDLDAGVANLLRVRANLKRYRAAVLNAAVEGNLTEDWRAQHLDIESASVLLDRILAERRRRWEEDQLAKFTKSRKQPAKGWEAKYREPLGVDSSGESNLPVGWSWVSVDQIAEDVTVGHVGPMKDRYISEGIPFLRSQNVRPLFYDAAGLRYIPPDFHDDLSKSRLVGGELLVVRSGVNVGDACVYPGDADEANCADIVITRFLKGFDAKFGAIFVNSPSGKAALYLKRTGNAQPHFNIGAMRVKPFPLPPEKEQAEIVARVEQAFSIADQIEMQIEANLKRAARLRQGILKRAFEGRLVAEDEPAEQLLARIREQCQPNSPATNGSPRSRRPRRPHKGRSTLPLFAQDDGDDQGGEP